MIPYYYDVTEFRIRMTRQFAKLGILESDWRWGYFMRNELKKTFCDIDRANNLPMKEGCPCPQT